MKKSKEVLNIEKIFYGSDREVREALMEKSHWLDKKYYLPGDVSFSISEDGIKHYDFIESLYNGHLIFSEPHLNIDDEELKSKIEKYIEEFCVLVLFSEINFHLNCDFWVELNFPLLDISLYNKLYPNFYPSLNDEEIKSFVDRKNPDICDAIKCLIFSKTPQNSIILSKNDLFNNNFYCNILSKIYVSRQSSKDLKDSLEEIANKWNIEIEEY